MLFADRLVSVLVEHAPFVEGIEGAVLEVHSQELHGFRELQLEVLGVWLDVGFCSEVLECYDELLIVPILESQHL